MYPSEELDQLARRKVILRGSIAVNRFRCVVSAKRVAAPLHWVDRGLDQWRKISPFLKFGALPLGFIFKKTVFPKSKMFGSLGTLLKFAPAAFGAFRAFKSMRSGPPSSS